MSSNSSFDQNFKSGIEKGFIDKEVLSEFQYVPKLVTNKEVPKEKVLSTILQEFDTCHEFYISAAFVTTSGIAVLLNSLLALEKRNIKGKVLVSQYLEFTQPEALKKLKALKNIELRISTKGNTHSKGYIFKKDTHYNIIIGSSNLTANALTVNKEWNLKVSGLDSSFIVDNVLNEFNTDFENSISVTDEYIISYEELYNRKKAIRLNAENDSKGKEVDIEPNSMQKVALENLQELRKENQTKALIISATGTGKTYLSAFDVKQFNPSRLLFVVHRLKIAKDALTTFESLLGDTKKYGVFSGNERNIEADFIFSTVQTISKEENLRKFQKDEFDYIIIDESHRSGGESYLRLVEYFNPKFLLGMTATPERTDGFDIFKLFDYNIAYEIRLHMAMKENMLSNFHYFGISDLIVNNEERENVRDFSKVTDNERAEKIIANARLYGCDNGITRGLVFCSSNEESKYLSNKFNENGFRTIALSGENKEEDREKAIERLESDDYNKKLDYIFTVDIFNEGIDIPKVNQILMIRPTESAIVFVQQLGRGLRKAGNKDFLTVVDFIGNYKNNYLIPVALYGDTTYNKDTLRKLLSEGSKNLPGSSTINFDEITKERIYQSIATAKMSNLVDLKKDYQALKYRLGRIPLMTDFIEHNSRDPFLFVEYSKSYYNFVLKVDDDFENELDIKSLELLELFSKEINNSKRVEESILLKKLIESNEIKIIDFKKLIKEKYHYDISDLIIESCILNINFDFIRKRRNIIVKENNVIKWHKEFTKFLTNEEFKKFLLDSINYSILTFDKTFVEESYKQGLILYNKYSRKDVCRLLNWSTDISSTVYGYKTVEGITPCFVTYHKADDIDEGINYNDYFITPSLFAWESKRNRKKDSPEIKKIIDSERILLFVKKEDAEGTDFYFMGDVEIVEDSVRQDSMPNTNEPIVHFTFQLDQPVNDELYSYIVTNSFKEEKKEEVTKDANVSRFTIPLYDFYAAAGSFSELQAEKDFQEIEVEERYAKSGEYFACKVVGESMNRRIPNGSICLFKKAEAGSRNGKIVLVENRDIQDPDFHSAFTVKTYQSIKSITDEGWEHLEIRLIPNSLDNYPEIIVNAEDAEGLSVIGEFIKVLE